MSVRLYVFQKMLENDCCRFKQTTSARRWSKSIQQINFTANLDIVGRTRIYFILEKAKEAVFEFSQGTVKYLWMQFHWV